MTDAELRHEIQLRQVEISYREAAEARRRALREGAEAVFAELDEALEMPRADALRTSATAQSVIEHI